MDNNIKKKQLTAIIFIILAFAFFGILSKSEEVEIKWSLFCSCLFVGILCLISAEIDKRKFENNTPLKILFNKCKVIITECEENLPAGVESCCSTVLENVKERCIAKNDASLDIIKIDLYAYSIVLNVCFDLLSSGEYHIFRGTLNPIGIAPSLMTVYEGCAKWLLDSGYITKNQYDENLRSLSENIRSVG